MVSSPIILNAEREEILNLAIGDYKHREEAIFNQAEAALLSKTEPDVLPRLGEKEKILLARQTGLSERSASAVVEAHKLADRTNVDAAVWFALSGEDRTTDLSSILAEGKAALRLRLKSAIHNNIIPPSYEEQLDDIVGKLQELAVEDLLEGNGSSETGDVAALLSTGQISDVQKRRFLQVHLNNEDPLPKFWERLKEDDVFDDRTVDELQLTLQLGTLTLNHAPLVRVVREVRNVADARELAGLDLEDWLELMTSVPAPEEFEGETAKEEYAKTIVSLVAKAYPTARLMNKWTRDNDLGTTSFRTFWNNNPEFEFRGTSVRKYVTENPGSLDGIVDRDNFVRELEGVHRLFNLVPDAEKFEPVSILWQANFRSAHTIVRYGRDPFLRQVARTIGEKRAIQVYAQSRKMAALSLATLVKYSPLFNQLNPQILGNLTIEEPPDTIPEWSSLFGSLDFCECLHCRSILSPTAYLVDLLQFLERADSGQQSALDALFERRPDLAHVRLDCANTNTSMPYIDLVNEVLENAVVNGLSNLDTAVGLQTTSKTEILRASPEHINIAAYAELAGASFPWSLPFNLWHEERAIYLGHLGIKAWELMDTFHREGEAPEPVDRAAAYFDMTRVERDIIVGTSGSHNLGSTDAVLTLMRRSHTNFEELEELLTSRFINPHEKEIVFADGSCALEDATLDLDNINERNHFHRFFRLLKITKLSVFELDLILDVLPFDDITNEFIIQLAFLCRLKERFKLPVSELVSWWARTIPTRGDGKNDSLYTNLFLNQIVNNPLTNVEEIFRLDFSGDDPELENRRPFFDAEGNLDAEISPLVVGALGITEEQLRLLIDEALPSTEMNFLNLSHLYRMTSLSRALDLTVRDILTLVRLTSETGITSFNLTDSSLVQVLPEETWTWVSSYDRLRGPGFRVDEISYLLLNRFEPSFALPLSDEEIGVSFIDLKSELRKMRPELIRGEVPTAQEIENITEWLTENLSFVLDDVEEALNIIRGVSEMTEDDQASFVEENFSVFLMPEILASLTEENGRLLHVYQQLLDYLSRNVVIQQIAETTGLEVKTTQTLLLELLNSPITAEQKAIRVFLENDFLDSSDIENPMLHPGPYAIMHRLAKLKVIIDRLEIIPEDLVFILSRGVDMGWYDLRSIPVEPVTDGSVNIEAWSRFLHAQTLSHRLFKHPFSLTKLFNHIEQQDATRSEVLTTLADQTGWEFESLEFLTGSGGYDFSFPEDLFGERWLSRLSEAFRLISKSGVSGSEIWQWNVPEANENVARNIKNASKSRHSIEQWLTIAPDLSDQLRIRRRDVLVDFLLAQPEALNLDIRDSDNLFELLLIDPAVQPCFLTSRIKQAISSVQLFVHRVFLGLESGVRFDSDDVDQWMWRKNYRIWEAGRKVFLYPENYAEPELRSDKSPFFQELENNLLQEEVTAASVERAYMRYLRNLDEVARLEIVGHYIEEEASIIHIFARTPGVPPVYYYCRFIDNAYFTAWEKVEVNIEGDHILPVIYNRRLWLLWFEFTDKGVEPDDDDLKNSSQPLKYHVIKLIWSEYKDGGWSSPKKSKDSITTLVELNGKDIHEYGYEKDFEFYYGKKRRFYFWAEVEDGVLRVYPFYHPKKDPYDYDPQPNQHFYIKGCDGNFFVEVDKQRENQKGKFTGAHIRRRIPYRVPYKDLSHRYAMKFRQDYHLRIWSQLGVNKNGVKSSENQELLLNRAPYKFFLKLPHQYTRFFSQAPLFYEDTKRTFLIRPEVVISTSDPSGTVMLEKDESSLNLIRTVRVTHLPTLPQREEPDILTTLHDPLIFNTSVFTSNSENLVIDRKIANLTSSFAEVDEDADEFGNKTVFPPPPPPPIPPLDPSGSGEIVLTDKLIMEYLFQTFYHPYSCLFIEQLNRFGIDGLLKPEPKGPGKELHRQLTPNSSFAFSTYGPQPNVKLQHPVEDIDFKPGGAYSEYNWEVFFHIPLLIADRLSQNQRFEEAQRWYHYIFDPTETDDTDLEIDESFRRFWKIKPFFEYSRASSIQEIVKLINEGNEDYENQVARWEADPFNPHLIARLRVVSYMKMVVMKYLDNLIAWADNLFQRDTIESINEATQLYILAAQILGRRPVEVPGKEAAPRTFDNLRGNLDVLRNALVSLETQITVKTNSSTFKTLENTQPDQGGSGRNVFLASNPFAISPNGLNPVEASSIFGGSLTFISPDGEPEPENPMVLYFCIPNNQKLLEYFNILADRLFKIRNCMNIEGVTRSLDLFEPPIDPSLIVKAAAAGLDLNSALNDLNAPLPHYRFTYMLQKAIELCNEVKGLGSALLSALEKKDAEALAILRAGNQIKLLKFAKELKKLNINESNESLEGLRKTEDVIQQRYDFYSSREFMNASEKNQETHLEMANILQLIGQGFDLAANIAHMVPDFKLGVQGMSSPEVTGSFGGSNVGQALQVYSKMYSLLATISSHWANMAGIKAGYERREEEWDFQAQLAEKELEQIGRQIVAAEIRVSIAEKDLANQELQIELAEEEDVFLQQKFTNQQLYSRMVSQISTAYFQTYQMAYDLAKQAERAFHHELGVENTNFIEFGYWDNLIKGLHSGDRLLKDLRRMELAYIAQNRREYELTQHFSLVLLNPRSLLDLKEKGKCEFHIPELAFDIAYPGQYMRRIKSVSLTIPCVTGPYVNISARLTLHNNRVRIRSNATEPYAFQVAEDNRFRHDLIGTQSIATSSGQNDSGLFELNFREERYLPFEGAGAISTWSLSLPEQFRQFDYESITDVIVTINYTAREGGDALRTAVNNHISSTINNWLDEVTASGNGLLRMFSMKREFSPALHKLQHPLQDSTPTTEIKIEHRHFPYFLHEREISVAEVIVILKPKDGQLLNTDNFDLRLNDLEGTDWIESSIADPDRASKPQEKSFSMVETIESEGNTWTFTINQGELPQVEDIWLLVRYTLNS